MSKSAGLIFAAVVVCASVSFALGGEEPTLPQPSSTRFVAPRYSPLAARLEKHPFSTPVPSGKRPRRAMRLRPTQKQTPPTGEFSEGAH